VSTGIYRDQEVLLLCPRCGDVLINAFEGVCGCVRCAGTWIPQHVVERAFGSPGWPPGGRAWWRAALDCPECATRMEAVMCNDVLVDRCRGHGVWLDQGEVRRVMDVRDATDLGAIQRKVSPGSPLASLDLHKAEELRARQAELSKQRAQRIAAERELRETERERAEEAAARAEVEALRRKEAEAAAESRRREAERESRRTAKAIMAERRRRSKEELERLAAEETHLEQQIIETRNQLTQQERQLVVLRGRISRLKLDLEEG